MADRIRKVLIVDDEPDMREFAQAALEGEGYQCHLAADGSEAIEKAKSQRPDLILMDVQMPKKDGFSTLYDLRQDPATKSIPVILLTGVAKKTGVRFSAEAVEEYMGERPQAFLNKPVEAEELRRTVRRLLGGEKNG